MKKESSPTVQIVVATHKKYQMPSSKIYLPLQVGASLSEADFGYQKDNTGDNISKKEILNECPDAAFGLMWLYKNGSEAESALLGDDDKIRAFNASHDSITQGTLRTYEYWFALDSEIVRSFEKFTQEGCSGGVRIKDNGDGTYSIISAPYNS